MELTDTFGRSHKDLRISVTDRCNYRCRYCMPEEGLDWTPNEEQLSNVELARVAHIFVNTFGFESIRITGGEPTLRPKLSGLLSHLSELNVDLALTTNGSNLEGKAEDFLKAGLSRINISLDSLQRDRFIDVTRRDELDKVLAGIRRAVDVGFESVKLNVVLMKGTNDDEVLDFLEFGRRENVNVRFIEFMPLDASDEWNDSVVVSKAEILEVAQARYEFDEVDSGSSPSEKYVYQDLPEQSFGIIPSVTNAFCASCDRIRLTCDGQIRNCLFASTHLDIKSLLRTGASDSEIAEAIAGEVKIKAKSHGIGQVNFIRPSKSMSQIGG